MFLEERIKSVWILRDQYYMSTLLHPSLKLFHISPNEKPNAITLVKQELLKLVLLPSSSNVTDTDSRSVLQNSLITLKTLNCVTSNDLLTQCFDQKSIVSEFTATPADEIDNYMVLNTQPEETNDVLLF